MRYFLIAVLAALAVGVAGARADSVVTFHNDPSRSGAFVMPGLTPDAASQMHIDRGFDGRVNGDVFAQPLYWKPAGAASGLVIVVTQRDVVDALDGATGQVVWERILGAPAPSDAFPCGNVGHGITGTPVIDAATGSIYLNAVVQENGAVRDLVFGLRLSDGAVLPGWPIDVAQVLDARHVSFDPRLQGQRGALALLGGRVFLGFGAHWGDCGAYRGIVLGLATAPPHDAVSWETRAGKGGIWAPGGISVADGQLFFATGNTAGIGEWADGEGVFRLGTELARSDNPRDFFSPSNWKELDDLDFDISGVAPLPIDFADGAHRLFGLGKDGNAYLLNRDNLGGIGGQIAVTRAANSTITGSPALLQSGSGALVFYQAVQSICPDGRFDGGLTAMAVTPSTIKPAWCAPFEGGGNPVVTTTDGHSDPIVWAFGAEGDNRLHAWHGDSGEAIRIDAEPVAGLRHFVTILAADGHLYIGGNGKVTAFSWDSRS